MCPLPLRRESAAPLVGILADSRSYLQWRVRFHHRNETHSIQWWTVQHSHLFKLINTNAFLPFTPAQPNRPSVQCNVPDSKVHGANMGPTWILPAPDGPHVDPMNLAIRGGMELSENAVSPVAKVSCTMSPCPLSKASALNVVLIVSLMMNQYVKTCFGAETVSPFSSSRWRNSFTI